MNLIIGSCISNSVAESDGHNIYVQIPVTNQIDNEKVRVFYRGRPIIVDLHDLVVKMIVHESIHIVIRREISFFASNRYDNISPLVDGI